MSTIRPASPSSPTSEPAAEPGWSQRLVLGVLVALLLVWGLWFIHRTSFEIDGERYYCLFDDAMISMTYARNWVEGHGLNWARHGEPVEGFTTPLWTLLMVPANLLPLDLRFRALPVQLLSLLLLILEVVLVAWTARRHFSPATPRLWLPAAVLTATYYPLLFWGLVGMETALQALLTTAAVAVAYEIVERERPLQRVLFVLFCLAYLTRMDMLLMVVVVAAFVLLGGGFRRAEVRRWGAGLILLLLTIGGYELFRWLYFHDVLPNTYYLKLTGIAPEVRILRGLDKLVDFLRANLVPLGLLGVGAAPLLRRRRYLLPAALPAVYVAYSIWVGGDAWEMHNNVRANRFLVFVLPQVFLLANAALGEAVAAWRRKHPGRVEPGLSAGEVQGCVGLTLVLALSLNGLIFSDRAPDNWKNVAVTGRPLLVGSQRQVLRELRRLQEILEPQARVAAFWAGIPAYFSDFEMVDILGYNDRHVARLPSHARLTADDFDRWTPGHMKWDHDYVFDVQEPDAFLQIWGVPPAKRAAILGPHGYTEIRGFWVRRDSSALRRASLESPSGPRGRGH